MDQHEHPYAKPMARQKTVWVMAGMAGLQAFAAYLGAAPDSLELPPILPFLCNGLGVALGVVGLAMRGLDSSKARTGMTATYQAITDQQAERAIAAPSKRAKRGFATVYWMLFAAGAALLAFGLSLQGCGASQWPAQCQQSGGSIACKCSRVRFIVTPHPHQPSPMGRLVVGCDGLPLPFQVDAPAFATDRAPRDP